MKLTDITSFQARNLLVCGFGDIMSSCDNHYKVINNNLVNQRTNYHINLSEINYVPDVSVKWSKK